MAPEKYGWVNALRGYAILLVILIHSSQEFFSAGFLKALSSAGDTGVQLFFILSSFTLFNSYFTRQNEKNKEKSPVANFFLRRFFRIAPYYYLAALFYSLYIALVFHDTLNPVYIAANILFINGLFLPSINYIPPGGWSVGVEMLFYLCIPLLYKKINTLKKAVLILILFIVLSNIMNYCLYYYITNYTANSWTDLRSDSLYFWFPNQFPVFIFGIILFLIYKKSIVSKKMGYIILFASLIAFILLSYHTFILTYPNYFFQREYVYALVFMGIAIGAYSTGNKYLINNVVQKIGIVSFSMYLNHFIILWLLAGCYSQLQRSGIVIPLWIVNNNIILILGYSLVTILTYYFSLFTYTYVETWGVKMGNNIIKRLEVKPANANVLADTKNI